MDFDFQDNLNEQAGHMLFISGIAGIRQRQALLQGQNQQIASHNQQVALQNKQVTLLEEQLRIEKNAQFAQEERLQVEQLRLAAENAERAWRRQQAASQMEHAERVRLIRNLIADAVSDLQKLKKRYP